MRAQYCRSSTNDNAGYTSLEQSPASSLQSPDDLFVVLVWVERFDFHLPGSFLFWFPEVPSGRARGGGALTEVSLGDEE